jgi:hypothetical protein
MPNPTDDYIRQRDHEQLDHQMQDYLRRGGKIETVARGVSGMTDGLYGAVGRHIKKLKASTTKLYDDQPDTEESE